MTAMIICDDSEPVGYSLQAKQSTLDEFKLCG